MSSTTVRVKGSTRAQMREIEGLTGFGPTEVLARAVDYFRRRVILADTDIAYAAVRAGTAASAALDVEQDAWDQTLGDGLDNETRG